MTLQCPLGKCQTPPIDTEAIKRDGWRDQGILVVHQDDTRLDPQRWDDTVQCLDLDNALKVMLDSLKGIVFEDDKFVHELHGRRAEPDGDGRLVVTISPMLVDSPQPSLI